MTHKTTSEIIDKLNRDTIAHRIEIEDNAPMSGHTSFRTGGCADLLVTAFDEESLRHVLGVLSTEGYPYMLLGRGTNVLVRDGGYRGAMVRAGEGFQTIERRGDCLLCGASALLSAVAKKALEEGLAGFEFASGIPGSMGGAVFMNAGAYGGEMAQVIESVRLISADGSTTREVGVDELELGYRKSKIQDTGEFVSRVEIKLHEGDADEIRRVMSELMGRRNSKQPVNLPSAGSFFKRPEGHFAGKLIEDSGLGGLSVGGAQVSELHKGFIVNVGGATATDITQLMDIVRATVMDKFGVMLEPEVRIVGEE